MNCGSPNSQLNILRQVMKGPLLSTTLELISSRSSESSEQYSLTLVHLESIVKCNSSRNLNTRRQLLREGKVNLDSDQSLNSDAFDVETIYNKANSRKRLERAIRIIISSVLLSNIHSQQSLESHYALKSREFIDHAIECRFYWK